ncbi:MAG: glycosyltransferase [Deltaproteobacteria bacterium]|nr:glycosyltransferase [Deltaproteobacteria bacterium]
MKVLHIINTLSAGGAELHLLTLCRHLKRHRVETVVACLREQIKGSRSLVSDFQQQGIRVVNLRADRMFDPRCLFKLIRLVGEEKPDIVHTHLPRADFAGAMTTFFRGEVLWVCTIHAIYSASWSGKWFLPLFDVFWRRANTIIAISKAVKTWLVEERRIPSQKIRVVHYGIEPDRFNIATVGGGETYSVNGSPLIGSIGRLERGKGYDILIEAMPAVHKRAPDALLLIAGHDPWGYSKSLQAASSRLGLDGTVRLVGFQNNIPAFLHALDVFVFASRSEGFGQAVIEAMAAGKPVVASKIPPLTEIVVDGESGLLVEVDNPGAFARAISSLLLDPEEARRLGKQGQQRVYEHFTAEKMSAETFSLYRELIS